MAQNKLCSRYDVIIVGSGIAGLLLAVELDAKGMRCALICKGRLVESNTSWAQGGVAICTGANSQDSTAQHLDDTLSCGAGLSDESVARMIVNGGSELFQRLESLGLIFDRKESELELAREGGHSQSRVLHSKDASGRAIIETLTAAIRSCKKLAIFEHMFAVDLLTHEGRCIGLRVLKDEKPTEILAARVVLASGGLGQVFERTTNPALATGDGIAIAYRAGADLIDMEFVQFHPTALYIPGAPASLISEAVRGSGAHLIDSRAERFAFRFHQNGELSTRDVVSRAILSVMQEQNIPCAWLDMRPIGAASILEKYPNIVTSCRNWGLDPLDRPIPVSPAAHYFMGGIWTDNCGRSSLPGLYAIGECAAIGLHGANRLASNSLLEGGVMAIKVAKTIAGEMPAKLPRSSFAIEESIIYSPSKASSLNEFRKQMFQDVGLSRNGNSLEALIASQSQGAFQRVALRQNAIEAANIRLLGTLIAQSALERCESRGAHWRSDFPQKDDLRFLRRYLINKQKSCYVTSASKMNSVTLVPTHIANVFGGSS